MGRLRKTVRDRIDHFSLHQRSKFPFPVNGLTEAAFLLYASELKELGVEVMFDFSEPSPRVGGFPDQLQRGCLHLLSSAVDAMPWGGAIDFNTQLQKEHIACMIRDSGGGMPEDQCKNVFDPLFQHQRESAQAGVDRL